MNKSKKNLKKIRFSIRLPEYQHTWLKKKSEVTKGTNNFESMNDIISTILDIYMGE